MPQFFMLLKSQLDCRCISSLLLFFQASICSADSLRDVYELALKNDATLKVAAASYRANIETRKQARANLLPQMSADGSYTASHQQLETKEVNSALVIDDQHRDSSLRNAQWRVSLTQAIFDAPAWFSLQSGSALSKQAEAELVYAQQELIMRVTEAYFNALRETENLNSSRIEESANYEQWQQSQARFNAGTAGSADVDQAYVEYEISVARRLANEGKLGAAHEALTAITGEAHHDLTSLKSEYVVAPLQPSSNSEWIQLALDNNFSLKAMQAALDSARHSAEGKRSEHLPKISGSLSYQDQSVYGRQSIDPPSPYTLPPDSDSETTMIAVKVSLPLFTSGYTSSQARQAYEKYNQALEKKVDAERAIIQNTRNAYNASSIDVYRVKAQASAIEAGRRALDATRAGYKVGINSIVDVLQTQRTLFATMRDHANARHDYVVDMFKLKLLAGTLNAKDIYEIDVWMEASTSSESSKYLSLSNSGWQ